MNSPAPRAPMSLGRHAAGVSLLLIAVSVLALLTLLPTRGSAGIQLPFLEEFESSTVVAFAGFSGCSSVCPTSLALMSEAYRDLDPRARERVGLLFINILRNDPRGLEDKYAQAFHPDFLTYTVDSQEADTIYDTLSLESFDQPQRASSHTGFIYVFGREQNTWRIERVFRRTPSGTQLLSILRDLAGNNGRPS